MKKIKSLLKYAGRYKKRYILGIISLILVDILQLVPPKILGYITDSISDKTADSWSIIKYVVLIVIVAAAIAIFRYIWRIFIFGTSRYIEYDMRNVYFTHLQSLSLNYYNKNKTGDLMALATNDLNAVKMALSQGVMMMTDSIVLSIATIIIMLTINVKLTLISLIPLPFVALAASKFGKQIHRKFVKVQESFSKLTDIVQENFSGIRIVKSFVQESKEYEKFTKQNTNYYETNMAFIRIWGLFSPLIEFLASLGFVILVGFGGIFVIYNYISLGDFISFDMYLGNLIWPMMAIGWVINVIQRGSASLERIEAVLSEKPEIIDKDVEEVKSINGDIEIKNLSFTYPGTDKKVLDNINLYVKKGQTLGIIGRTGSSKSTLVNLLVRLYNVDNGQIIINRRDINRIPLEILRENIGFVPQDAFLFSNTVAENINLPCDNFSSERIECAAKDSDIYNDIIDFTDKFDTVVGERGVTLSGGQKQRISIARALVKNPEILIFDDCLSAVDAKTEVRILQNLKRIMKDKTSIIISHRISAVKDSDFIAVFDQGKIIQYGKHEELIKEDGLYKDIYDKQLLEEKISEEPAEAGGEA